MEEPGNSWLLDLQSSAKARNGLEGGRKKKGYREKKWVTLGKIQE